MRKLIIATAVVLLLGTGNGLAVDALETEQSIIKLFIYDKDCAPLPDSWREMVTTMLRAMGETDLSESPHGSFPQLWVGTGKNFARLWSRGSSS